MPRPAASAAQSPPFRRAAPPPDRDAGVVEAARGANRHLHVDLGEARLARRVGQRRPSENTWRCRGGSRPRQLRPNSAWPRLSTFGVARDEAPARDQAEAAAPRQHVHGAVHVLDDVAQHHGIEAAGWDVGREDRVPSPTRNPLARATSTACGWARCPRRPSRDGAARRGSRRGRSPRRGTRPRADAGRNIARNSASSRRPGWPTASSAPSSRAPGARLVAKPGA